MASVGLVELPVQQWRQRAIPLTAANLSHPLAWAPGLTIRRNGAIAAMSVANRASKYSTLLPRESNADPNTLFRQIAMMSTQVASEMPAGNEVRERALKLLDKANTILQSDSLRSAEVDYYLQQVRSMIERVRQSFGYSALYKRRLQTYLLAWLALTLVVIFGCLLYGNDLVALIALLANWDENSIGSQHLVALLFTLFAGALGGVFCAFWSMRIQKKSRIGISRP